MKKLTLVLVILSGSFLSGSMLATKAIAAEKQISLTSLASKVCYTEAQLVRTTMVMYQLSRSRFKTNSYLHNLERERLNRITSNVYSYPLTSDVTEQYSYMELAARKEFDDCLVKKGL